jgi:SAM-dependent methyltransferase
MYDAFGTEYDRFVNWDSRLGAEMPFLVEQLRAAGAERVLDTGCGTGMHAVALAGEGFEVVAADASTTMVEAARANVARSGLEVSVVQASFGSHAQLDLPPFDAVLCLGNSLPHVLTETGLAATLSDFGECLRPTGSVIIQSRNFDSVMSAKDRWMAPQSHTDVSGLDRVYVRFYDFEPSGLLTFNIVTLSEQPGGGWRQAPSSTTLWPQRMAEVKRGLQQAGFSRIDWYGDLQGRPYDPAQSPNLVAVGVL